jgi:hypothetical protein
VDHAQKLHRGASTTSGWAAPSSHRDGESVFCAVRKTSVITTPILQFCNLRFTLDLPSTRAGFGLWRGAWRPLWPSQEDRQASLVDPQCIHHTHIHTDNHPFSGANHHHHQQPPEYNTFTDSQSSNTVGYENVTVGVSGIRPSGPALLQPAPWGTLSVAD